MWDVQVGVRIRKYRGHQTFVNTCDIVRRGPQLLCSGSDDGTLRVCQDITRNLIYSPILYVTFYVICIALCNTNKG